MEEKKESKLGKMAEEALERTIKDGLTTSNLDTAYKLAKIKHMEKEEKEMYGNYGNYSGRGPSGGAYGEYGEYGRGGYGENYGRRGRDRKYRGDEYMERMQGEYGRYEEGREQYNRSGNYGAKEDATKSLRYMLEATVDFFRMLDQEAKEPEEKQLIREYAQRIAQM